MVLTDARISPGSYSTVPIVGYDLLPTFARLAGFKGSLPPEVEGGSFHALLLNQGSGKVQRPREGIYFSRQVDGVLIQDDFKLIRTHRTGEVQLFNLGNDLSESNDLSSTQPELTAKMHQALKDWMDANDVRTPSPHSPRGKRKKAQ